MKMSKEHSTQLWNAVIDNDFASFHSVNTRLLNTPSALKHAPIRMYIPSAPSGVPGPEGPSGSFKVVQSLIPLVSSDRKPRTLGQALRETMPSLFPSSRDPVLANVVLHGASVPFYAPLEEIMREAAYPDGWLCLVVVVL